MKQLVAAVCLVGALSMACSKDGDGGGSATGGQTATGGNASGGSSPATGGVAGLAMDAPPATGGATGNTDAATQPPQTCAGIRNCQLACADNAPCVQRCVDTAAAAARAAYDQVHTCSIAVCPDGDETCRCETECLGGGACTDITDECRDMDDDTFCDVRCH